MNPRAAEIQNEALLRRNGALVEFIEEHGLTAEAHAQGLIPPPEGYPLYHYIHKTLEKLADYLIGGAEREDLVAALTRVDCYYEQEAQERAKRAQRGREQAQKRRVKEGSA